jgi:hypothetical protein
MKYLILTVLLSGFAITTPRALAQDDYLCGYIINNEHDTIHGMIKDRNEFPLRKYSKIRFIDQRGKKKKLGPGDIRGYVRSSMHYETRWYDGKVRFLRPVVKGWVSYYQYEYAINSDDGSSIETEKLLQRFGENNFYEVEFLWFRKRMIDYFSDCPEIVVKLQNKEYRFRDLEKLVADYNRIMLARKAVSPPK